MSSPGRVFEYAVLQVVPRIERGELINAGVLLYCHALDYLGCRVHLDTARLRALDPQVNPEPIQQALTALITVCAANPVGAAAHEPMGKRFRWLTAPKSTVVRAGPVHTGFTTNPEAELNRLLTLLVLPPLRDERDVHSAL